MKERPILFSGPMVRALMTGTKTQTRRAIKLQTGETFDEHALVAAIQEWRPVFDKVAGCSVGKRGSLIRCPYGVPGDRLWVRERWAAHWMYNDVPPREARCKREHLRDTDNRWFAADGPEAHSQLGLGCSYRGKWRQSIHMPRWASRILLEVTEVRVERLQDISEADCRAEGIDREHCEFAPRAAYHQLWESINGSESWAANPWVWAVSFKRGSRHEPR